MPLEISPIDLDPGEWIDDAAAKDSIFLHHTAGSHRPDWTISGWNRDRGRDGGRRRVATAFIIGGLSTTDGSSDWDGRVLQCFADSGWAYHLGVRGSGGRLDRKSIGIELCNYGPLTLSADGAFYNYVNRPVPPAAVVELDEAFRGYRFYHRYTAAQLDAARQLLDDLGARHGIDIRAGLRARIDGPSTDDDAAGEPQERRLAPPARPTQPFEFDAAAYAGDPGLWTHTNVRKDKFDCSPQPELIAMIRDL